MRVRVPGRDPDTDGVQVEFRLLGQGSIHACDRDRSLRSGRDRVAVGRLRERPRRPGRTRALRARKRAAAALADLPEAWRPIVIDCLSSTHERRATHDAASLLRRIEGITGLSRAPRLPRLRPRRWQRPAMAAAAVATAMLGVTAYLAWDDGPTYGYHRCPVAMPMEGVGEPLSCRSVSVSNADTVLAKKLLTYRYRPSGVVVTPGPVAVSDRRSTTVSAPSVPMLKVHRPSSSGETPAGSRRWSRTTRGRRGLPPVPLVSSARGRGNPALDRGRRPDRCGSRRPGGTVRRRRRGTCRPVRWRGRMARFPWYSPATRAE